MITRIGRYVIQAVRDSIGIVIKVSDEITGKELETITFTDEYDLPDVDYCPSCKTYYEIKKEHYCYEPKNKS